MPIDHSSALPSSSKLQRQAERGAPVSKGAEGAAVREAQALLHAHGFDPGPADGDMGALTSKDLARAQDPDRSPRSSCRHRPRSDRGVH